MARAMSRGKGQVLRDFLPGRTFDFQGSSPTIGLVTDIRGTQVSDLNAAMLLRRIEEQVTPWDEAYRPTLRDSFLEDPTRWVFLDPTEVRATLFPRVFWCQRTSCGQVTVVAPDRRPPSGRCGACGGDVQQMRFVRIHGCGELFQVVPFPCARCKRLDKMALETRGSERISEFRWVCRRDGTRASVIGGYCNCNWPERPQDPTERTMRVEVHRAGSTFYPHSAVLLNAPKNVLDAFLGLPETEWKAIAAAKFMGLPEVANRSLRSFASSASTPAADPGLSGADINNLFVRRDGGDLDDAAFIAEMARLREQRRDERVAASPSGIRAALERRTGVDGPVWQAAGQELLEAVLPSEFGTPSDIFADPSRGEAMAAASSVGLASLDLVSDFPIVTATYGYSRGGYQPGDCHVRAFPPRPEHRDRTPIFVDTVQADALLLRLDHARVVKWLERNGYPSTLPSGDDPDASCRAYFVELLAGAPLRRTLGLDTPQARMVFGLLHTLSHLALRQSSLLCGLDSTSLTEYLLPRGLVFGVYANHRASATIGALAALFEQSLTEWLGSVREARRCVYDPDCRERGGNCHYCTHLAENSCRFFNLNLGRAFLFGGVDRVLGPVAVGYFDPSLVAQGVGP